MKSFNKKVVVITGAGSGIGRALAQNFAKKGAYLAISDLNKEGLAETVQLCNNTKVYSEIFNVAKKAEFQKFAKNVLDEFGRVDVVINNAGVALGKTKLNDTTYEEFEWLMGINFWGVVYGTKEFLPSLLKQPEAAVVNISSLFGLAGIGEQVPYCSSKFAVRGLTESLRMELLDTNVSVHTVHPGGIKTNIANNARISESEDQEQAKKVLKNFNKALIHTPEKAAQVIIRGIEKKQEKIMIGFETYVTDVVTKVLPTSYSKIFDLLGKQALQ
ncbi:MAG TPA: SDR family oxidoreductase [Chitinophagales bacterium]|nr:SDR family oxidoreductase [Chitinophagales bacterium]MCB9075786.1 SDR family oxidoreductase [Chitinophagales bacterium]HMU97897.1 SDR family oxidoreductase [Chitinophagales bacterium]HMV02721.1 SDR family oxidoreductase [Chitinophagales bacterium]HMW94618.1 SDR family oxidoreductase [Chitinophagales bacterium]